jgi:hypothetical protein
VCDACDSGFDSSATAAYIRLDRTAEGGVSAA